MQYNKQITTQEFDQEALFIIPKKGTQKIRKWREIEEFKARQQLLKELRDIDYSFNFSVNDLI